MQLNALQADIEIQKALIRKTEILAPFDGVIIDVEVDVAARGLPSLSIVGLPDKAVEEAKGGARSR